MQQLGYLLDTLPCMGKAKLDILCQLVVDEPLWSHPIDVVHHLVEIIGRDIKLVGIKINGAMLLVVLIKQSEELDGDCPSGFFGNKLYLIIYICLLIIDGLKQITCHRGNNLIRHIIIHIANCPLLQVQPFVKSLSLFGCLIKFSHSLKFYRLKMSQTSLMLTLRNLRGMAEIGFATFLTEIAMSVTILIGNYQFMSMLHENGVAAFAIICYLFPIIFSVNNAVAQAAQPIISYNYGAGQKLRVRQTLRLSLLVAITCGILVMLTMIVGAEKIVEMFLRSEEKAYGLAIEGLHWFSICSVFFCAQHSLHRLLPKRDERRTRHGIHDAERYHLLCGCFYALAINLWHYGIMARYSCCRTGYAAHHYNPASKKIERRCISESRVHKINTNCISLQMLSSDCFPSPYLCTQ